MIQGIEALVVLAYRTAATAPETKAAVDSLLDLVGPGVGDDNFSSDPLRPGRSDDMLSSWSLRFAAVTPTS